MKSTTTYTSNPSQLLFKSHEHSILSTRQALFSFITEKSPAMGVATNKILHRKLEQASKDNLPVMFELFPWIIKDLTGIGQRKINDISINWLALNLYVAFLDDHLDSKTEIKAEEFLGASILAHKGLINLFKIVHGTEFEKLFNDSLFSAAHFQLEDVLSQSKISRNKFSKLKSAYGKNGILIACAGALAAAKLEKADFIIDLTKSMLLSVQLLDDLADFESDFKQNNITTLLNDVATKRKKKYFPLKRRKIISDFISTGALLRVTQKVEQSLSTSVTLIENNVSGRTKSNPSYRFFTTLYVEVVSMRNLLEGLSSKFKAMPTKEKRAAITEVDKSISKICMHS
ncbi:MAG: hypothetical protein ABIQ40_00615 [Bacteroidia bacterium]